MTRWNHNFSQWMAVAIASVLSSSFANAQSEIAGYRYVERTVYEKKPVTVIKEVEETVYEKKQVTTEKHVWQTEQREKRTTVKKPVTRTTLKEERTVVQKPVTETKYREKRVEETTYDLVTEMREQEYTVRKPVIETGYRDEQFNVRQKITEDLIEVKNETVYKPKTFEETAYVSSEIAVTRAVAAPDPTCGPRMEWLTAGYYTDPTSGQQVWRRRGLHWVQPTVTAQVADTVPTLVPTTVQRTSLVPETVTTRRPVEVSRYEDRVETRRVPFEVERMVTETATRQVPITVKKPVTKTTIEQVPYTQTRYVEEVVVTKIPVEETVYEEVVEVEPYEVEVGRWIPYTEEIEVPRTVVKKVEVEEIREVPRTIWVKVPVDASGRFLSLGTPVSDEEAQKSSRYSTGYGETSLNSVGRYRGSWNIGPETAETSQRSKSVLVPETEEPTAANPGTKMEPLDQPEKNHKLEEGSASGADVDAADQAPTLNKSALNKSVVNDQTEDQIASLQVLRRPVVDAESGANVISGNMPSGGRPEVKPNHNLDVLAAERE